MDSIDEYWKFTVPKLPYLQNVKQTMADIIQFMNDNNCNGENLINHPSIGTMSPSGQVLVGMNELLHKIHPSLIMLLSTTVICLNSHARNILLTNHRNILAEEGAMLPDKNYTPIPIIGRYELIITTGDPLLVDTVESMYVRYRQLARKTISTPVDWLITKYKQSIPAQNKNPAKLHQMTINEFTFKGKTMLGNKFILQKTLPDKPVSTKNHIELLVFVEDGFIENQDDIEELRQEILLYIDLYVGEARSFKYMRNFTLLPLSSYENISKNFPQHYILQDWSEFSKILTEIVPDTNYCCTCYLSADNTDLVHIIEEPETKILEKNYYCRYCFSFLTRLVEIEKKQLST